MENKFVYLFFGRSYGSTIFFRDLLTFKIRTFLIAPSRSLEIVFGFGFQVLVMHQIPTILSLIGAGLVLISIIAISLQDFVTTHLPQRIQFLF